MSDDGDEEDDPLAAALEHLAEAIEHLANIAEQVGIAVGYLAKRRDPWQR